MTSQNQVFQIPYSRSTLIRS